MKSSWKWVKCKDIIDVRDGTHDTPKYVNQGIPLITSKNLTNGVIDFSNALFISEDDHEKISKRSKVDKGDIIMPMIGTIGNPVCVNTNQEFSIKNVALFKLNNIDSLLPKYFYYLLGSSIIQKQFSDDAKGVTQKFVSLEVLRNLNFPLPPLEEQKRIAEILSKCDNIRRIRKYSLQVSDTYLQSVFLEMFGDFLTLNLNTKNKFKDTLEIPLSNGGFTKNQNYGCGTPIIWVDDLYHTNSINISNLKQANFDSKSIEKYKVLEGDLLFTRSSLVKEGTGQINIVPKLEQTTLFECHIIRARVNKNKVNPYYILGLYRSQYGRNLIMQRANTGTMTTIAQEALEELLCPIPPLPLQDKFAKIIEKFERFRNQQQEAQRQADHLFQTLLHQAFTGKL